ncbi:uncharacterized protein LOC128559330 [Mercenaria mercenaria]|uniref:uncharacterized protein LOC128559330 n=1 Tax=Mercenaria mercenaria TaxID=6596 RepID=UPI00234F16C3|nr:uncharacterized protein LOC128559330 [Mercenaria mercenaria]
MDGIPIVLFIFSIFTARIADGASCNTKFSDASFLKDFGLKASSESTENKASHAFTVGWCSGTNVGSPTLEVDFKQPYGISSILVSGPTNRDGDPYPTNVLVKYVPNGGDVNNFVHFPLQEGKLEIKLTEYGTVQSNFGQGIAARKLQFTIQSFNGDACLKIDLLGCTINDLCTGGCQNGGLCMMQDTCQCPQGTLGSRCESKECTPEDLGLADGRIGPDHIHVSSEDPVYNKAEMGNSKFH